MSGERLLMGKGVLVIRSHFKEFVFVWTAQPASFSFLYFCADGDLLVETKMATAIMSGATIRLTPDMSTRDMIVHVLRRRPNPGML
jgi:hypothetical protein